MPPILSIPVGKKQRVALAKYFMASKTFPDNVHTMHFLPSPMPRAIQSTDASALRQALREQKCDVYAGRCMWITVVYQFNDIGNVLYGATICRDPRWSRTDHMFNKSKKFKFDRAGHRRTALYRFIVRGVLDWAPPGSDRNPYLFKKYMRGIIAKKGCWDKFPDSPICWRIKTDLSKSISRVDDDEAESATKAGILPIPKNSPRKLRKVAQGGNQRRSAVKLFN